MTENTRPTGVVDDPSAICATAGIHGYDHRCHACGQPLGYWATDKLTGLLDRWGWDDEAPRVLTRAHHCGEPTALMIIDLDLFKEVNDRFGHPAGDAVLRGVAAVLRDATRSNDLLGRYGGDEFLALLPATGLSAAVAVAHRIQSSIKASEIDAPTVAGVVTITGCTVSIGVAAKTAGHPVELLDLLLAADVALREAKRGGRDQVRTASPPTAEVRVARRNREMDAIGELELHDGMS